MRAAMWIRLSSILTFVFLAGHLFGTLNLNANGPKEAALFDAMRAFRFDVMGSARTHWDFYYGLNWLLCVHLLVLGLLMWRLAALARIEPQRARPFMTVLMLGNVLAAALCWRYFFVAPALTTTLAALCLAIGLVRGRRPS
jgi:hypothetical protein